MRYRNSGVCTGVLAVVVACATQPPPPAATTIAATPATTIIADPSMAILVASADTILHYFGPPDQPFYVADSLTARVLDRSGATTRYKFVAPETKVFCSGNAPVVGNIGRMKIDHIAGDSAGVAWMATCLRTSENQRDAVLSGSAGLFVLQKVDGRWTVLGMNELLQF